MLANAQTTAAGPYYATPSWDQTMPASSRFVVLSNFNSEAVLDRETGLVWQRTPQRVTASTIQSDAVQDCSGARTGGRAGWRVPTIYELGSLFDPANLGALPPISIGHPFTGSPRPETWCSGPQPTCRGPTSRSISPPVTYRAR